MSFPRYTSYRDSGVEWLGEVPSHWDVKPFRYALVRIESGTSVNARDTPTESGWPGVLKTSCVYTGKFDASENKSVVSEEIKRLTCPVKGGTVIVSRMNTPELVGAAGLVPTDMPNLFLPDRLWQLHFADAAAEFIHYWTQSPSYRGQVQVACTGTSSSMQNLSQSQLRAFSFPAPPLTEQRTISAFLDRETAKIDALVEAQRRLIELLKEKRQAVISHAVTKGLDPFAPMKDSDVEWLGEVPLRWKVLQARRVISRFEQGWSPECDSRPAEAAEWGVLKTGCVNGGIYREEENKALPPHLSPNPALEVREGDLLMSRASGSPDLIGSVAQVHATRGRIILSDKIFRLVCNSNVIPKFILWMFASNPLRCQIINAISGADGMANNLPQSGIKEFRLCLPPVNEQQQIVEYLDAETSRFDHLILRSMEAVSLLQERRAALISTVVTGKIDVRNFATKAEAA